MTSLSINLNKFALVRNARGMNQPNLINIAKKCIDYGVNGITLHPRPDERHVKIADLEPMKKLISDLPKIELNVEGFPSNSFIDNIINIRPHQVTLVPDPPESVTSSFGWDCKKNENFLEKIVKKFQEKKIRVSLFINPSTEHLSFLKNIMPDRVELYTYDYADIFMNNKELAIKPYMEVEKFLHDNFPSIEINAGHDLNLNNLSYFLLKITSIKEVSIGHAIICDTFEYGLKKTLEKYLKIIKEK